MDGKVKVINHPLLKHKLGYLRDKRTNSVEFRDLVKEISVLLAYEAMRDWNEMITIDIETPIAKATVERITKAPVVVSILRAGNGMLDSVLSVIPFASAGFIGIYRDKFINKLKAIASDSIGSFVILQIGIKEHQKIAKLHPNSK